jgi:hypothetical protein
MPLRRRHCRERASRRADAAVSLAGIQHTEQLRERLHGALHRGGSKATEAELAAISAVVLAVVAEIATDSLKSSASR